MDNLLKEIALRVDDINFDDFDQYVYRKALLVSQRKVAKRYKLVQRFFKFVSHFDVNVTDEEITNPGDTEDILLPFTNFVSEYRVLINGIEYHKVSILKASSKYDYVLERNQNQILFNYWFRQEDDEVRIYYTSDINKEDSEVEEYEAIIPSQYKEEVIDLALMQIAKLGMVKFANTGKERKYDRLRQLYALDERSLDANLIKNDSWVEITIYQPY